MHSESATQEGSVTFKRGDLIAPEAWMIGAQTRLVDCWQPQIECLRLPRVRFPAWETTTVLRSKQSYAHRQRSLRKLWSRKPPILDLPRGALAIDLRPIGSSNIAHAMIGGVISYLVARQSLTKLGVHGNLTAVLSAKPAKYITDLYHIFDIPSIQTDGGVTGRFVEVSLLDHQSIQMASDAIPGRVARLLEPRKKEFPSRVFLARRGSRAVTNLDELQTALAAHGFTTIFLEQLSVLDQLRLMWQAEEVVGVHGAALALLLPRVIQRGERPLSLVEMFGAGYIVSLYRGMCAALGANWAGVRGRVTPEAVRDLEWLGERNRRFRVSSRVRGWVPGRCLPPDSVWQRSHQRSSFEVDQKSVELALMMARTPSSPLPDRVWGES